MPENLELRGSIYYLRIVIDGVLHRKSTGFSDLKLARRRAVEMENEIRSRNLGWIKKTAPTFPEWVDTYLAAYHPATKTERGLLRRPTARWQTKRLDDFVRTDFETYLRDRERDGAADGTLERERVLLRSCFQAALADGILTKNPLDGIRPFKPEPRTRVLTRTEEEQIRGIAPPHWDRFLTVMLGTGLRLGELRHARPMDLREDGSWLWVRPESNKTKTGRLVPLRASVRGALSEQQRAHAVTPNDVYFRMSSATAWQWLSRACGRLKIEDPISPHSLRRTFATRCAELGMYPRVLQKILGHASIEITMRYYVHMEKKSLLDAIEEITL